MGADNTSAESFAIDLARDDIRAIGAPGESAAMTLAFNIVRGQLDTSIESNVLAFGQSSPSASAPVTLAVQRRVHPGGSRLPKCRLLYIGTG